MNIKKLFKSFVISLIFWILFTSIVMGYLIFNKLNKDGFFPSFIYLNEDHIEEIKSKYDEFPEKAFHIYYAQGNGRDPIEFLAFSASKEACKLFLNSLGITIKDMSIFNHDLVKDKDFPKESNPHAYDWSNFFIKKNGEIVKSDYWRINEVKKGLYYSEDFRFILYDTENNRIYLLSWSM